MVSLRRRKNLGLSSGIDSSAAQFPKSSENGNVSGSPINKANSVIVPSISSLRSSPPKKIILKPLSESLSVSGSSSSKEESNQQPPVQSIKRRKRHRRKNFQDQETCVMRGVYFKNMKWQAAIKVDKKQIHLGTVGTQEEAARLYDRAAFMCGREPNFEIPEEEKQELRRFNWEEFLTMTRSSITNKKNKRESNGEGSRKKPSNWNNGKVVVDDVFSSLEDVKIQKSIS